MRRSPGRAAARLIVLLRLDGPALGLAARVLRRAPRSRVAASLGWHLGQAATRPTRVAQLESGSRLVVDVRDYAHRHMLLFGVYEEHITRLMERLSRPAWTVVDVGANAGYHSLLAADLGGPGSKVVAFEPGERMAGLLRRSLALSARDEVELVAAACWDQDGSISFSASLDPRNSGLSSTSEGSCEYAMTVVPCVRLDRWCEERGVTPDLVKIDVEGAELRVLHGSESLLRSRPPEHVICEVWPDSRGATFAYMAALGYEPHGIAPDGSLTVPGASDGAWSDICFRHRHPTDDTETTNP